MRKVYVAVVIVMFAAALPVYAGAEPQQSPRMERAKDLIAEEQWERAIEQLKAAAADPKERQRDEALFWLAHSQHQAGDTSAAVVTIASLERSFPSSRWVKPARSLRIEIAQKLHRSDVLWLTATPRAPLPPAPPAPASGGVPAPSPLPRAVPPSAPAPPPTPPMTAPRVREAYRAAPAGARPAEIWVPEDWEPDMNLRIQALGSLMRTDAQRVIPILKEIAMDSPNPNEASRALFVLAQSGRPDAHSTVLDVARRGSESAQIAAVKELGRFGGPKVFDDLLEVYGSGNSRVKYQIVSAFAERAATTALMKIAESEADPRLRQTAIIRLGRAGGAQHLQHLYWSAKFDVKRPVLEGLFNARADEALIAIAEKERDAELRSEAITRLRLLGTAKARAFLARQQKR